MTSTSSNVHKQHDIGSPPTKTSSQCLQSSENFTLTTGFLINMNSTEMQSRRWALCESRPPGGQLGTQPAVIINNNKTDKVRESLDRGAHPSDTHVHTVKQY